jgi:bifunctional non-homologous end joining protein LigD
MARLFSSSTLSARALSPMLATLADEPFDDPQWIFEIKWDGYRCLTHVAGGKATLYSRNHVVLNDHYPELAAALKGAPHEAILDGEIVVLDEHGKPIFQALQQYRKRSGGQLRYFVFDILEFKGRDVRQLPLLKRKQLLKQAVPKSDLITINDHIEAHGSTFFAAAQRAGLEGIIAKQKHSPYISTRSPLWLKIKTHLRQEAVIGGFTAPRRSRKEFGALVLGVYRDSELVYVGHTGGGFNTKLLREVKKKLLPLTTSASPFAHIPKTNAPVTWVKPTMVCEVEFNSWTDDGVMRQPIFLGLREDKKPTEVRKETSQHTNTLVKQAQVARDNERGVYIDNVVVPITHSNKIYFPRNRYTKKDVIDYYRWAAPLILPYLQDRPQSLLRHPNGITGKNFFQKNVSDIHLPEWVDTERVYSESNKKEISYLVCSNAATLIYIVNLGCIEINPWFSRVGSIEHPDYLVLDLDPDDLDFNYVIKAALATRQVLEKADIPSFPKTSGKRGMHIYIPVAARYDYSQAVKFSELLATVVHEKIPQFTSVARSVSARRKKLYIDYLQNRRGQTLAAPYSLRPVDEATVATPLRWSEVTKKLHPSQFTIKTIRKRIEKVGDLFTPVLGDGIVIEEALKRLN